MYSITSDMPFDFEPTRIEDVILIKSEVFEDNRGFLLETYEEETFAKHGLPTNIELEFYSSSQEGVLRGLHQQTDPHQQAKIIRCFKGEIFDVAVDVRPNSDTFGEYVSQRLSEENKHALYIPRGFLHGFATISKDALVHYVTDNGYVPESEQGVIWNDPDLGINWPIEDPIISEKDKQWPLLQESIYACS